MRTIQSSYHPCPKSIRMSNKSSPKLSQQSHIKSMEISESNTAIEFTIASSLPTARMHFQRFCLITPPQICCNLLLSSNVFFHSLRQLIWWVVITCKTALINTPEPSWFNNLLFPLDALVNIFYFNPAKLTLLFLENSTLTPPILCKSCVVLHAQQFRDTSSQTWIYILAGKKKDKTFLNLLFALI